MRSFSPETLQQIAVIGVFVSVAVYLLIGGATFVMGFRPNRADSFLRFRQDSEDAPTISAEGLRNTLMASALSLGTAIYVYLEWAATDGLFALWSPITWTLGVLVLVRFAVRIFRKSRREWTLHAFLGNAYDSQVLTRLTSTVTITFFVLQIAAEVFVGVAVLNEFIFTDASPLTVAAVLLLLYVAYSIIGGLPSVLHTDTVQFWVISTAIAATLIVLLSHYGASGWDQLRASAGTFAPQGLQGWVVVLSLLAINLPLLITDMSVWQRLAATSSQVEAKRGTWRFAIGLVATMSLLVVIGAAWGPTVMVPAGMAPVTAFVSFLSNTIAYPLLMIGFVAAILSTADTLLISVVQTFLVDWRYHDTFSEAEYDPSRISPDVHLRITRDARLGVIGFGVIAAGLGYIALNSYPTLLGFLFAVFAIPVGMAPALVWALLDRSGGGLRPAAEWSVGSSFILGLLLFAVALMNVTILGVPLAFWSPVAVLTASTVVFALGVRGATMGDVAA